MIASVMEITEFALRPGCSEDVFMNTAGDVNAAASKLRGFKSRRLLKSNSGWIEIFEWEDMASATAAAEIWSSLPGLETYCSMVDHNSMKFGCHPIMAKA